MKRILPFIFCLLLLCACGNRDGATLRVERDENGILKASGEIFAMDTYMTITCFGDRCEEALNASFAEIRRLDGVLSVGYPDSEVSCINQKKSAILSDDTAKILSEALRIFDLTDGAFDCTVYPVMKLWGFTSLNFKVPKAEELQNALKTVGSDKLSYDPQTKQLRLQDGAGIDFGGIAKGYTSDRLMRIFKEYNLVSGSVSLGGNVQFYGAKTDGNPWRCAIQNPDDPNGTNYLGVLSAKDTAVITSGAYQRNFTDQETGNRYHHIIDPKQGVPVNSGLSSVTIVSKSGLSADALSTAVYVMGIERAKEFWREYGETFDMVLQTDDKTVYVTAPIADQFTSDFKVQIIQK